MLKDVPLSFSQIPILIRIVSDTMPIPINGHISDKPSGSLSNAEGDGRYSRSLGDDTPSITHVITEVELQPPRRLSSPWGHYQTPLEELVNALTHGLGLVLSIGGLALLVTLSSIHGTASHIVSSSIYGASLVLVFAASTCYHATPISDAKRRLRVAEQALIFVLIAGTYTPFTLAVLQAGWGWSLFGVVWGLAAVGIILNTAHFHRYASISIALYLGLGWLGLVSVFPLMGTLALGGLMWLLGGGIAYSLGVIFLSWRKLPLNHGIWHIFVLMGSLCHYFAVLFNVVPL
jgi:hemolysin III